MRKKKSIYNIIASLGTYIVSMLFNFVTQALIIKILGIEYSGVNGLFTNIITMLSVAELGIGTTIIFKLYKPIAEDNIEEIKSWMKFYKICYRIVAIVVTIVGILIIPIVPIIVGEVTILENVITLYLISLLDTILSYIMTYKRSLLYADQKNYIINVIHIGYTIFMNVTQIIFLLITKNYIIFLCIKLIYRLIENCIINLYVNKNYSYIKEKATDISKENKKDVWQRIKAIFLQKISFVINKGIDSITISYFLGVTSVGYYTNYNLIATTISGIIYQVISGFCASIGNLLTERNFEKNYNIYKKINMINSFITGIAVIGFCSCIQPFISLWLGDEYLLSEITIYSFAIYIYADSIRRAITIYKEAAGICKEDQWAYVIMALTNLVISVILCKSIGIPGVILGTAISYLFLIIYSYPKYIFKPLFKKKIYCYYYEMIKYLIVIIISAIICFFVLENVVINNSIIQFLVNAIISISIYSILFVILFFNTNELKYFMDILKGMIKKSKMREEI